MGWRGKFLFLLIVYFAGFATAVYYLAPSGRDGSQDSFYSTKASAVEGESARVLTRISEKAYASLANVDWTGLKEKFSCGIRKVIEKIQSTRSSSHSSSSSTNDEGSEDK
jgi:hypothetical protein